jgi:hypothetical protein
LNMDRSVKVWLDQGQTRSVNIGRGVRQGCCLSQIIFDLYTGYLTKETFEGFGDYKIWQVIWTVKYAMTLCCWIRTNCTTGHDW